MSGKLKLLIEVFMLIVLCGFFFVVVSLPYGMEVTTSIQRIYEREDVEKSDIKVKTKSLLGISRETDEYAIVNESDDKTVVIRCGLLERRFEFNKIPVSYVKADYKGKIYQHDSVKLTDDMFSVSLVYHDGKTTTLTSSDYQVDGLPDVLSEDVSVKIDAYGYQSNVTVRPIKIVSLDAVYDGGLKIGDTFDMSKVSVTVRFADGTNKEVDDISSSFEGVVTADSDINIVSEKYGDIDLPIDKSNVKGYDVSYADKIYEGDVITADKLKISAQFEDGTSEEIKDLTMDEVCVFEATQVKALSKAFGTLKCTITPVAVKEIVADASVDSENHLTFHGLQFVYTDGTTKDLNMDDVTFVTDLSVPIKMGQNEIKFTWFEHEYSFIETLVD